MDPSLTGILVKSKLFQFKNLSNRELFESFSQSSLGIFLVSSRFYAIYHRIALKNRLSTRINF